MLKSEGKPKFNDDQEIADFVEDCEPSTPVSPVNGMIPSSEERIISWLENNGVQRGSPRFKKDLFFKESLNSESRIFPLVDSSLANSRLLNRRSIAVNKNSLEKSEVFIVRPIKVPRLE